MCLLKNRFLKYNVLFSESLHHLPYYDKKVLITIRTKINVVFEVPDMSMEIKIKTVKVNTENFPKLLKDRIQITPLNFPWQIYVYTFMHAHSIYTLYRIPLNMSNFPLFQKIF